MTPARAISAQRHSPEVTGDAARSADDIFLFGREKEAWATSQTWQLSSAISHSTSREGSSSLCEARADERLSGRPPSGSRSSGTRAASKIPAPVGCRCASKPTRAPERTSAASRSASFGVWRLWRWRIPGFSVSSRRSRSSRSDSCRAWRRTRGAKLFWKPRWTGIGCDSGVRRARCSRNPASLRVGSARWGASSDRSGWWRGSVASWSKLPISCWRIPATSGVHFRTLPRTDSARKRRLGG